MRLLEFLRRLFGVNYRRIAAQDFLDRLAADRNAVPVDVRKEADFRSSSLPGAIHLPAGTRLFDDALSGMDKSKAYYVFGYTALSSGAAARRLATANLVVYQLDGSFSELPVPGAG